MAETTIPTSTVQAREGGITVGNDQYVRANLLISWRSDPEYGPLIERYPAFGVALADYYIRQARLNEDVTATNIAKLMAQYNVPRSAMPFTFGGTGGGGGRSAEARENTIRSYQTSIMFRAKALGMTLKPEEVDYIARVAEAQNYSTEQLDQALVGLIQWDQIEQGTLTGYRDQIVSTSKMFLIDLPEDVVLDWATRLATGQATKDGYESLIRAQAKMANPWLAKYIDEGLSPFELLAGSRRAIAQGLEIDEATVDFTDPEFMKLATITDDKGNTRLASAAELRSNLRQDPRWASTDSAKQLTATLARRISQIFGRSVF